MLKHEYQSIGFLGQSNSTQWASIELHDVPSDMGGTEKIKILVYYSYSQETYSPYRGTKHKQ